MSKDKYADEIVAHVYSTFDYDRFKFMKENRGAVDTDGVVRHKIGEIQHLIDADEYVDELSPVWVNEDFLIIQGRHTFETRMRNGLPIRYEFITDHRFNNGTPRRKMIMNLPMINKINTRWNNPHFFKTALAIKLPLAEKLNEIVEKNDNTFSWSNVLAILLKDTNYFSGKKIKGIHMSIFEDPKLLDALETREFKAELKWFSEFYNKKAKIAQRRTPLIQATYDVIWKAHALVKESMFRDAVMKISDNLYDSAKMSSYEKAIAVMIDKYNYMANTTLKPSAVRQEITAKSGEERPSVHRRPWEKNPNALPKKVTGAEAFKGKFLKEIETV